VLKVPVDGTVMRSEVGLELAQRVLAGVREEALRRGLALSAVVVDLGGQVVAAMRMDGAQLCAIPLATDKAYTAVAIGLPTRTWTDRSQPGRSDWGLNTALAGRLIVFPGGLPIFDEGRLLGGLGVSGASADEDEACGFAGFHAAMLTSVGTQERLMLEP
jgi:uncharacterized protein GlcG (DUF336 family)